MKLLLSDSEINKIFKEAANGYGFVEVNQAPEGIYCTGCNQTHKRPTKMYSNRTDVMCKIQVALNYNPEE